MHRQQYTPARLRKEANPQRLLVRLSARVDDKETLVELFAFNATLEPFITI